VSGVKAGAASGERRAASGGGRVLGRRRVRGIEEMHRERARFQQAALTRLCLRRCLGMRVCWTIQIAFTSVAGIHAVNFPIKACLKYSRANRQARYENLGTTCIYIGLC
jgi:hypothetical protein